jgi:hypothetical protein
MMYSKYLIWVNIYVLSAIHGTYDIVQYHYAQSVMWDSKQPTFSVCMGAL